MIEIFSQDATTLAVFASVASTSLFLAALAGLTELFGHID